METGIHTWQGDGQTRGHCRYGNSGQWSGQGMDKQSYYPGYTNNTNYYHTSNGDVMTCDPASYSTVHAQVVPVTSSQSVYGDPHYPTCPSTDMEHWHLQMLSQTDPYLMMSVRDGSGKRKRRRVISMEQRKAANVRERSRMNQLNDAFDVLRKRVPTFAYEKKLSRIETLKLAVNYIEFMKDLIDNGEDKCKKISDDCEDIKDSDNNNKPLEEDDTPVTSPRDDDVMSTPGTPSHFEDDEY